METVRKLFERHPVWTYHAVVQRLSETGRDRIEPRLVRTALAHLSRSDRPQILEPLPGIFVHRASDKTVAKDVHNCVVQLGRLQAALHHDPTALILELVLQRTHAEPTAGTSASWQHRRTMGGAVHFTAIDRWQHTNANGKPVLVWTSHDVEWIELHQVRLWRFLEECWQQEATGVIVARKIEPAVFALLSATGLRGLQYYSIWANDGTSTFADRIRKELRWIRLDEISNLQNHAVRAHLLQVVHDAQPVTADGSVGRAISDAVGRSFAGSRDPTVTSIVDWWNQTGLRLPTKTHQVLSEGPEA